MSCALLTKKQPLLQYCEFNFPSVFPSTSPHLISFCHHMQVLGRTGRLRYAQLLKILVDGGLDLHFFTIEKEPGTIDISAGKFCRLNQCIAFFLNLC